MSLYGVIADLSESEDSDAAVGSAEKLTDEALQKTHGYEGSFKVGDVVRVNKSVRIWSVKPFTQTGVDVKDYVGTVSAMALYGRKLKSLCSAITPIKVEFQPDGEGMPKGVFERKFLLHFAGDELELVK